MSDDSDMDSLVERLAEEGCDEALARVGKLDRLASEFVREAHFAVANYSGLDAKMQSPEGSRLRGLYFRLHSLMIGECGSENTSVELVIHYSDEVIFFSRQDSEGRSLLTCIACENWRTMLG